VRPHGGCRFRHSARRRSPVARAVSRISEEDKARVLSLALIGKSDHISDGTKPLGPGEQLHLPDS
jgi:hypothetical protein